MPSLFDQEASPVPEKERSLPQDMRQLIVNLYYLWGCSVGSATALALKHSWQAE